MRRFGAVKPCEATIRSRSSSDARSSKAAALWGARSNGARPQCLSRNVAVSPTQRSSAATGSDVTEVLAVGSVGVAGATVSVGGVRGVAVGAVGILGVGVGLDRRGLALVQRRLDVFVRQVLRLGHADLPFVAFRRSGRAYPSGIRSYRAAQ